MSTQCTVYISDWNEVLYLRCSLIISVDNRFLFVTSCDHIVPRCIVISMDQWWQWMNYCYYIAWRGRGFVLNMRITFVRKTVIRRVVQRCSLAILSWTLIPTILQNRHEYQFGYALTLGLLPRSNMLSRSDMFSCSDMLSGSDMFSHSYTLSRSNMLSLSNMFSLPDMLSRSDMLLL
jgi:hypothetical protein